MSTIGTHLNWGASYVVNDFYKRFIKPEASEKELVRMGRLLTVLLMMCTAIVALWLENAKQAFDILLQIGAGTGLIFILRWFWWRINAFTEISAMIVSFLIAVLFKVVIPQAEMGMEPEWYQLAHWQLVMGIILTTVTWLIVTFATAPVKEETLKKFVKLTRPGGPGWRKINKMVEAEGFPPIDHRLPLEILSMVIAVFTVYGALFATGFWIYDNLIPAITATVVSATGTVILIKLWGRMQAPLNVKADGDGR